MNQTEIEALSRRIERMQNWSWGWQWMDHASSRDTTNKIARAALMLVRQIAAQSDPRQPYHGTAYRKMAEDTVTALEAYRAEVERAAELAATTI